MEGIKAERLNGRCQAMRPIGRESPGGNPGKASSYKVSHNFLVATAPDLGTCTAFSWQPSQGRQRLGQEAARPWRVQAGCCRR
jgi:hypothetical protein